MPPPPLPPAAVVIADEAVVVVDRANLPADVATLVDPAVLLPGDVRLFERRFTLVGVLTSGLWSIGLGLFGGVCVLFGIAVIFSPKQNVTVSSSGDWLPLGFGLTCLLAAWVMADTARARIRLRRAQVAGRPTRVGILLTPALLIESGETSWVILPRTAITGIGGGKVRYRFHGLEKAIYLPDEWMNGDRAGIERAIAEWLAV